ncbi:MAG: bifunctional folylpolyglutamate synthase/dihydrofolate synthase [Candidatus Sericytochromatia bacterium]|nr:bifunctional folylpolyglutamate synthase/dihydrofolate synthase [Candidatus Sericytochromatia bacterium]
MNLDNILQNFRKPYPERKHIGLDRMYELMRLVNNPQNDYPSIHVAGTNGKGSVSAMLHSVFCNLGYKVGIFTSPHLERFTERIKINDQEIREIDFLRILNQNILPAVKKLDAELFGEPTEFEIINAVAFYYFSEQKIDLAIFEAGLGGRLDSTNVLKNVLASIITSVSYDHTDRLGNTLEKITGEKAGIIKENVPVIINKSNPHHEIYFQKTNLLYFASPEFLQIKELILENENISSEIISYPKVGYRIISNDQDSIFFQQEIFLPFIANYQLENLAIVLKTLDVIKKIIPPTPLCKVGLRKKSKGDRYKKTFYFSMLSLPLVLSPPLQRRVRVDFLLPSFSTLGEREGLGVSFLTQGIKNTKWSGRFEFINYYGLQIILDGAHNEQGIKSFSETFNELAKDKNVITIFACNKNKDYQKMLDCLTPFTDFFVITKSHVEIKATEPNKISEYLKSLNKDHQIVTEYSQSIKFASKIMTERSYNKHETLICICGSLYLIGSIRAFINSKR